MAQAAIVTFFLSEGKFASAATWKMRVIFGSLLRIAADSFARCFNLFIVRMTTTE